jgi:hypothetical protein
MAGCHPALATDNVERFKRFRNFVGPRAVGLAQEISMHKDGKQTVASVEARGGRLGRPVLMVLLVSCVLAVAALIVAYSGT